jgi:phage terminase Nu1 subunit (DNA packaging protein)
MIVERSVLAECLNLSGARICQLVKEGMPKYARGLYDLGACIQWYIKNRVKSANKSSNVVDARKRRYEVQTHKNGLETARTRAATIEADLYLRDLQQQAAIIDRTLTQPDPDLADDIADLTDANTIGDRLQLAVDRVRTRIADDLDDYTRTHEV